MIIGLNGYIGSGKDTVGNMIQYLTSGRKCSYKDYFAETKDGIHFNLSEATLWPSKWQIKKFAEKLKVIASLLTGIPREKFEDQEFKKQPLDRNWTYETDVPVYGKQWVEMTVRTFLQKLGTEAIRDGLHTNAWVNALFADYKPTQMVSSFPPPQTEEEYRKQQGFPDWIITDTRFPNEAEAIKARGGIIVRIERYPAEHYHTSGNTPHISETGLDDWKFDYVINNTGSLEELLEATRTLLINIEN